MTEQKTARLTCYFEEQAAACGRRCEALLADERADEAVFEKVRANVYDIFRTVLSAAVKAGAGEPNAVKDFFVSRIEQIPAAWAAAYEKARAHNDEAKMHLEQIKLDAVSDIKARFAEVWEGEQ